MLIRNLSIIGDSSSCIDLIFTSQPNLVMESGVFSSLHPNCRHQIIYAKFNLKIYYPPPYEWEIWYYEKANVDHIKRPIDKANYKALVRFKSSKGPQI